ncbi:ATP-binding protein [Acinetobacter sp. NCu2D-2]|uniref:AAA family ATPase n=1 Tax=Acinetobacter sp. NCu2D-2 TaxID=1608473 RepID=UPI0007CDA084|nr:AAA family ATPase [Acinetobacter sp. NCu2D-2]ANF82720.1 ATP-binding protein [Acinetobacter sp. NCu2D-2]
MQVESLQLKHVLHFSDLKLDFKYHAAPVTLILGDQGSGKTTLMRFCYQALTWFVARQRDIRTAGLVMLDQDIMLNRLQSKIEIGVKFSEDIGAFDEASDLNKASLQQCRWHMYKTLNAQGVGISKVETQQLDEMVNLYQRAIKKDPLLGLPLIAYYPEERFVNDINLISKNNPAIFQTAHAYELTAIPFTTFARFFEWIREISDIENAQSAQLIQDLLKPYENTEQQASYDNLAAQIAKAQSNIHAPALKALRHALSIVIPGLTNLYIHYAPKLQLMVEYQGQKLLFQQLSNSVRNWVALVGDIVRRLCVLNPKSLFPCQEGTGILMIDAIDHQLDQEHVTQILPRLHQAFPQLQILATGNRSELLDQAQDFQCLQLNQQQVHTIDLTQDQQHFEQIYADLGMNKIKDDVSFIDDTLIDPIAEPMKIDSILESIQHLSLEQKQHILESLLAEQDTEDKGL